MIRKSTKAAKDLYILFLEEYIKELEDILDTEQRKEIDFRELLERIKEHQKITNAYQPVFVPGAGVPIPNNCPKCGIVLDRVMSYCCSDPYCPTGMGPVMC